jgi:hypothetical protein
MDIQRSNEGPVRHIDSLARAIQTGYGWREAVARNIKYWRATASRQLSLDCMARARQSTCLTRPSLDLCMSIQNYMDSS